MKMFQLAFIVIGSFGTGFLLADGLAKSAPELVFVQGKPTAATTRPEMVKCAAAAMAAVVDKPQDKPRAAMPEIVNHVGSIHQAQSDIAMPLASYSALVALQQRPATELILQIDDADFVQMIEQQQQDQQFDAQSEL